MPSGRDSHDSCNRLLPDVARKPSSDGQELCESGGKLAALLLTEHWVACSGAGRDLFRAIQVLQCSSSAC